MHKQIGDCDMVGCPICNKLSPVNIELNKLNALEEKLRVAVEKVQREIDSLMFYEQGRDPVIKKLTEHGRGQLAAWQSALSLLVKFKGE